MTPPFSIIAIDHIVLHARNPKQLQDFYIQRLGCTLEREVDNLRQLRAGNALIDIVPISPAHQKRNASMYPNMAHFCLRIEPFDANTLSALFSDCIVGDVAQRFGAEGVGSSLYITDPEENIVELKCTNTPDM